MPSVHLTDLAVQGLKPLDQQQTYWDQTLPAFGLRVGRKSKTFVVMIGRQRQRITIGHYPSMALKDARRRARSLLVNAPADRTRISFDDALQNYLELYCRKNNKPSTVREKERLLERHFPFGNRAVDTISASRISAIIDKLPPSEANHAFVAIRTFLNWCISRQYLSQDPMLGRKMPNKATSRTRVLDDEELRLIWAETGAADRPSYKAIRLLLLFGQRCTETASLEWSFINQADRIITLPPRLTKNNSEHTFPYGDFAATLLASIPRDSKYVFPGVKEKPFSAWGTVKRDFDKQVELPHWTFHDLRRTFSTIHARIGTPPHITELILNHKVSSHLTPIAKIYNRHTYLPEMRDAMQRYETSLGLLLELR